MSNIRHKSALLYYDSSDDARDKREKIEYLMRISHKSERIKKNNMMAQHKVPGVSIAIIENGKLASAAAYSLYKKEPLSINTLFQAASVSKPVSAMGALRLVEMGLIELSDDIRQELKSWTIHFESEELEKTTQNIPITLQNMLAHIAGFNGPGTGFCGYARSEFYPTIRQVLDGEKPAKNEAIKIIIPSGKKLIYSGGGYTVMQILLEDIYKKKFGEKSFTHIMRDEVFKNLGMISSGFDLEELLKNKNVIAKGHDEEGIALENGYLHYPELAAAGLWTTPSDLYLYVNEIISGLHDDKKTKVLSSTMIRKMLTEQLPPNQNGLGLLVKRDASGKLISFEHPGTNKGFTSDMLILPESGQGVIVMTNSDNGHEFAEILIEKIKQIYKWPKDPLQKNVMRHLFVDHMSLFKKMEKTHLVEHRHDDPKLQHEYDKRFGLIPYKKR